MTRSASEHRMMGHDRGHGSNYNTVGGVGADGARRERRRSGGGGGRGGAGRRKSRLRIKRGRHYGPPLDVYKKKKKKKQYGRVTDLPRGRIVCPKCQHRVPSTELREHMRLHRKHGHIVPQQARLREVSSQ